MRTPILLALPVVVLGAAILSTGITTAEMAGNEIRPTYYVLPDTRTMTSAAAPGITMSTAIDEVALAVNSVWNKYKMIRIGIENHTLETVVLDASKDEVLASTRNKDKQVKEVRGILNLARTDPAQWSALPERIREKLAYPGALRGRRNKSERPQPIYFFVFFPAPGLNAPPDSFTYKIHSKGTELRIQKQRLRKN